MRRLLLFAVIVAALFLVSSSLSWAGNTYTAWWEDSLSVEGLKNSVRVDTMTIHAEDGEQTIDLGAIYYNIVLQSLNGAGDSGHVTVKFDCIKGITHTNAAAQAYMKATVGDNSGDDKHYCSIGTRYLYVTGVKDGTADSTCLFLIKAAK